MYLASGSIGNEITIIQNNLKFLNYDPGKSDGIFGRKTEKAVKDYQKDKKLICDGIVGKGTYSSIRNDVEAVQNSLNSKGIDYNLICDGIVGINTKNALMKFQADNGLEVDGICGENTRRCLENSIVNTSSKMNISNLGINFIANYEDYFAESYRGEDFQNRTIGYGHVILDGENLTYLTEQQAKELLICDLKKFVNEVNILISELNLYQNQFDALVSFAYNVGAGEEGLAGSTLLKDIKSGAAADKIREDFMMWCMCNEKKSLGLYRRRNDESNIYLNNVYERTYISF